MKRTLALLGIVAATFACAPHGHHRRSEVASLAVIVNNKAPATMLMLQQEQFVSPFTDVALLSVSPDIPNIEWSATGATVALSHEEPKYSAPAPTAPPDAIFVQLKGFGVSTVTARAKRSHQRAVLKVYTYPSVAFGCRFRYTPSIRAPRQNQTDMPDAYQTAGSDLMHELDSCQSPPFATAPGSGIINHFPYGAAFADGDLATFPSIRASRWRNDFTQTTQLSGLVLFKTADGRIVKALLPLGPYEETGANGVFPY